MNKSPKKRSRLVNKRHLSGLDLTSMLLISIFLKSKKNHVFLTICSFLFLNTLGSSSFLWPYKIEFVSFYNIVSFQHTTKFCRNTSFQKKLVLTYKLVKN